MTHKMSEDCGLSAGILPASARIYKRFFYGYVVRIRQPSQGSQPARVESFRRLERMQTTVRFLCDQPAPASVMRSHRMRIEHFHLRRRRLEIEFRGCW